jgi:hypothetical protein
MTNYILHTTLPCQAAITKGLTSAGAERRVMLGLDLELKTPARALIIGGGPPLYVGKQAREIWIKLVTWLKQQGCEVHVVQEACGFGWESGGGRLAPAQTQRPVAWLHEVRPRSWDQRPRLPEPGSAKPWWPVRGC